MAYLSLTHQTPPRTDTRVRRLRGLACLCLGAALAFSAAAPAEAQENYVAGLVVDGSTGQPLPGAQVVVQGTQLGMITDARGRFRLEGLSGTEVTLEVVLLGYRTQQQAARVGDGAVRVEMLESAVELDEIVVTGTAGGTQRRAVGNSVSTIDASKVTELAPVPTVANLINGRATGVVVEPSTGMVGSGPRIRIRGASSFSLSDQPLIYVDGVRVNNAVSTGINVQAFGSAVISRLNDINPDDIESMEIIKGPAAATLYGTEASNGVIQIITKKGAAGERPRFNLTVRQGASWFNDAASRIPVTYWRNPDTGGIETQNIVQQEIDRGTPIFRTGYNQSYHMDVSGGSDRLRYYVSGEFEDASGIEPTNGQQKFNARTNITVAPSDKLDITASLGLVQNNIDLVYEAGAGGIWFSTMFNTPELRDTPNRGFLFTPPEVNWATEQPKQKLNRFTGSVQVNHRPTSWFSQRLSVGTDLTNQQDSELFERVTDPYIAQFLGPSDIAGWKYIQTVTTNYGTVDYSGTVNLGITQNLGTATSLGAQYYRTFTERVSSEGNNFPAPDLKTVDALAQTFGGDDYVENVTVGVYGQEQFSWKDRAFLTVAVRADDNSAFGENFDLIYYPKVSGSWVISEEPFWNLGFINTLKLRGAYGQSGQQPETFAALQSFEPVTAGNGGAAVTPQFIGNPDLAPERGEEVELGFEAGLLQDRLGIDFTYYNQRTEDAILLRDVAPSTGFGGTQFVNVGALRNRGLEVQLNAVPVQRRNLGWDVTVLWANNDSEVLDLGGPDFIAIGSQRHQVGFPVASWFREKVVSADLDADGNAINVMCDGGRPKVSGGPNVLLGGDPVPCSEAPRLFLGRASPSYEGSVSSTITLFNRLRLYGLFDFKGGHKVYDNNLRARCQIFLLCRENVMPQEYDPARIAEMQSSGTLVSFVVNDASFIKFRELSASYTLPDSWVQGFGVSRASITVSGRNLHTWTDYTGLDPEAFFTTQLHTRLEQDQTPQLRQFLATMSVTF